MGNIIIRELSDRHEILEAFQVMRQLRSHLDEASYLELVTEAKENAGYVMYGLFTDGELAAVTGFQPMTTLYYGRFIWICDLVTDSAKRSEGYGEKLLSFVHDWARNNNFESVALSSGLQRTAAHRFYEEKMSYDKVSYVFKHTLD
ncbi:GNAT family N-acetyltransferase [Evansella clarkii]|jgi:GNAT superfamily N-acetyltransferase|uniref:GNAT family N-acetyltransferase n=1 Tax=Evansella clarkii TaxID=79879 RepID=UPI0009973BED|nr:GNAT family N-acetyltransferase [Evansella clarkii]